MWLCIKLTDIPFFHQNCLQTADYVINFMISDQKRCRNRGRNEWTKLPGRLRGWWINQFGATAAFTRPEKYWVSPRSDPRLFTHDNFCSDQHKQTLNELHIEIDRLKLQNKDQQWKLVMAGSGPERVRADFSAQTSDLGQAVGNFPNLGIIVN